MKSAFLLLLLCISSLSLVAGPIVALTNGNQLVTFDSASPSVATVPISVTGLGAGQTLVGIDYRPTDGALIGVALNSSTGQAQVYTIAANGAAVVIQAPFSLMGGSFGVDFNPVPNALRIVSDAKANVRITVGGSGVVNNDTALPASTITGAAYSDNLPGGIGGVTTLYVIDSQTGGLFTQGSINSSPTSPNSGQLFAVGSLGLGTGLSSNVGFDILGGNTAYLSVGSRFYGVNLGTGAATLIGSIGTTAGVLDIAAAPATSPQPAPNTVMTTSAANYRAIVAPDSIVSGWGTGLALNTISANTNSVNGQLVTLSTALGSTSLSVRSPGTPAVSPLLYMVSPGQVNYVVPTAAPLGISALTLTNGASSINGTISISNVSPALFTADASGNGVPVGVVQRVPTAGGATTDMIFQGASTNFTPKPINLSSSPTDKVYLILYGTGIRRHSLNPVVATIGGIKVPVQYAGAQSQYPGFDQVNLGPLPQSLIGKGTTDLIVSADGVPSNTVKVAIQ